ncbi:hypothetical protein [Promicromonospora soli]
MILRSSTTSPRVRIHRSPVCSSFGSQPDGRPTLELVGNVAAATGPSFGHASASTSADAPEAAHTAGGTADEA